MNTYLKEHSATDLVTELKKRMGIDEEKAKSEEQVRELKKDRKNDDEKIRMRRKMKMKEDETRKDLIKKQERLTSSLLMMKCGQMVKRVTRYTTSYFRQSLRALTSSSSATPSSLAT